MGVEPKIGGFSPQNGWWVCNGTPLFFPWDIIWGTRIIFGFPPIFNWWISNLRSQQNSSKMPNIAPNISSADSFVLVFGRKFLGSKAMPSACLACGQLPGSQHNVYLGCLGAMPMGCHPGRKEGNVGKNVGTQRLGNWEVHEFVGKNEKTS